MVKNREIYLVSQAFKINLKDKETTTGTPVKPPKTTADQHVTRIREIYLTFDDGIQAGTEEVVDLLNEKGVESAYKRDSAMCLRVLKKIYDNHAIGNHSYSHANDFYTNYYRVGGVKIGTDENGKAVRRSVVDDFAKAKRHYHVLYSKENYIGFPLY